MSYSKLPADPTAMILGIISIVVGVAGCCCYGVLAIIPLAVAIIGLVMANKSLREYDQNAEAYMPQSRSNVYTAKILNIIGVVMNGAIVLMFVVFLAFYGSVFSGAMLEEMRNGNSDIETYEDYDFEDNEDEEGDLETYEVEEVDEVEEDTKKDSIN